MIVSFVIGQGIVSSIYDSLLEITICVIVQEHISVDGENDITVALESAPKIHALSPHQ